MSRTDHLGGLRAVCRSLVSLCLLLLLAPSWLAGQSDRAEAFAEARRHAEAERYEQALAIFRRLVDENPQDYEARTWVARLEGWRGNHKEAERLYHRILREDPDNLEAALGLADVLAWQARYQEAERHLAEVAERYPANARVRLRRAKIARWQGRREEAERRYQGVLELDPDNREARQALVTLRRETRYQLSTGYFFEEFDFASNTNGQFVELLYHDLDNLWLLGRFEFQNKFDENNTRYTLGTTYQVWRRTWLRLQASLAPPGDTVIANQDYTFELTQQFHPRLALGSSYRFLNFRQADVHVVTALANLTLRRNLRLYLRYSPARTQFETGESAWNQNGWGRLEWAAHRRVTPFVFFAVGSESFAGLTVEELGRFAAQTWGGGAEVHLTPRQGFRVRYYFQNRTRDNREQGFSVSYFFRF